MMAAESKSYTRGWAKRNMSGKATYRARGFGLINTSAFIGSNLPNRRHSSRFARHPPRIRNQPVWVVRVIAVYVRSAV